MLSASEYKMPSEQLRRFVVYAAIAVLLVSVVVYAYEVWTLWSAVVTAGEPVKAAPTSIALPGA